MKAFHQRRACVKCPNVIWDFHCKTYCDEYVVYDSDATEVVSLTPTWRRWLRILHESLKSFHQKTPQSRHALNSSDSQSQLYVTGFITRRSSYMHGCYANALIRRHQVPLWCVNVKNLKSSLFDFILVTYESYCSQSNDAYEIGSYLRK